MSAVCKDKGKSIVYKHIPQLTNLLPMGVLDNISETTVSTYFPEFNNSHWQIVGAMFLTVGMEDYRQARRRGWSWRHQYDIMFIFIQTQVVTYENIYRYVYIHELVCTHEFLTAEVKEAIISQQQLAHSYLGF